MLHAEAAHRHAVDPFDAGGELVAPRDVVGGARRQDLDLGVAREMFGDVARVQLRAAVDRLAVALNDDRELHCGSGSGPDRAPSRSTAPSSRRLRLGSVRTRVPPGGSPAVGAGRASVAGAAIAGRGHRRRAPAAGARWRAAAPAAGAATALTAAALDRGACAACGAGGCAGPAVARLAAAPPSMAGAGAGGGRLHDRADAAGAGVADGGGRAGAARRRSSLGGL